MTTIPLPLTATAAPQIGAPLAFDAPANLFIARNVSSPRFPTLDGFDTGMELPASSIGFFTLPELADLVAVTDGNDGNIYILGAAFGLATLLPGSFDVSETAIEVLPGVCVDLTNTLGTTDLFVLRDQESGDSFVDQLSLDSYTFTASFTLPEADLGSPVGVTDGRDGRLYVAGRAGGFAVIDPVTAEVTSRTILLPGGVWEDLTGSRDNRIFLLRRIAGDDYAIDVFDIDLQEMTDFGLVSVPGDQDAVSITDGPEGLLYVLGGGSLEPTPLTVVDPDGPGIVSIFDFTFFEGFNVGITNLAPRATPVPDAWNLPQVAALQHRAAPNPFNPRVEIAYELEQAVPVRIDVVDLQGRRVRMLFTGYQDRGAHAVTWDGRGEDGRQVASGTYLYRIQAGNLTGTGKLVLAK